MAKKKSGSKQGTEQTNDATVASDVDVTSTETGTDTVENAESSQTADGIGQGAGASSEDTGETNEAMMTTGEVNLNDTAQFAPDASQPSHTTGEISLGVSEERDDQMLSRMRAGFLTPSEVYREAQLFSAQKFDVNALLNSGEPHLVHNVIEMLRVLERWNPAAIAGITSNEARTREVCERYLLYCLKNGLVSCTEFVDVLVDRVESSQDAEREQLVQFVEKVRTSLVNLIAQHLFEIPVLQNALTKLCTILDSKTVGRMLYDPNTDIRVAVIRSLMNRQSLDLTDLTVTLVMLKDRDTRVNMALIRLYTKFAIFPELVIPQVLTIVVDADKELRALIDDMFRSYGSDAVGPVINALGDTQHDLEEAVADVIAASPMRYTTALLNKLANARTPIFVRNRLRSILQTHNDVPRRPEILRALYNIFEKSNNEQPVWTPPDPGIVMMHDPVLDNTDFYKRELSDKEITLMSAKCDDSKLISLLSDASEMAKRNALKVVCHRKEASVPVLNMLKICMKSPILETAHAAFEAHMNLEKNEERFVSSIIDAMKCSASDEVKRDFMNMILGNQKWIIMIIHSFYQNPRLVSNLVIKIMHTNPSAETIETVLHGLDRTQSVTCISETEYVLLQCQPTLSTPQLRATLMNLAREPISFGHYGFLVRLYALKVIDKYFIYDRSQHAPRDPETIQSLQAFYKEAQNAELKNFAKKVLKNQGEEIFDFDDEEDDFEDLEEEHED